LEELEDHMQRNFGTTDVVEMPDGMMKRAIVRMRFNRLMDIALPLTEACEAQPDLWKRYDPPIIEMGRRLEP
jgi:hypothetical protein